MNRSGFVVGTKAISQCNFHVFKENPDYERFPVDYGKVAEEP